MSLKEKATSGLFWAFIEQIGNKIIQFIIGIILARLLNPAQFGLIGMLTVFISVSESISAGGFSQALIRKDRCSEDDYNTSFIFNIVVGSFLYSILFFSSSSVATFYNEPMLSMLLNVLALQIIIDSLSFVQNAKLLKELKFKELAKVSVISQVFSGTVGIWLAYSGFGVWSLVLKIVLGRLVRTGLLIFFNHWTPKLKFSLSSFKELFGFGSKMLLTTIIERLYANIYNVVIGKFYNKSSLGYYSRANQFKSLISEQMVSTLQRVSVPLLSNIQKDKKILDNGFKKMINISFFISIFGMMILIPSAKYMILFLIGSKWYASVQYLQLLAISGILYPVSQVNLNYLQIIGRSDLILKLQVIKKVVTIPFVIIGIICGIKVLIYGIIAISITDFVVSSWYSGKFGKYSFSQQIKSFLPHTIILVIISLGIYYFGLFLKDFLLFNNGLVFFIQVIFYFITAIIIFNFFKIKEYLELKDILKTIVVNKFLKRRK